VNALAQPKVRITLILIGDKNFNQFAEQELVILNLIESVLEPGVIFALTTPLILLVPKISGLGTLSSGICQLFSVGCILRQLINPCSPLERLNPGVLLSEPNVIPVLILKQCVLTTLPSLS
jgi:hypothetical protein